MLKLSQFHLKLTFMGASTLSENIQDDARAIEHTTAQLTLNVSFLAGAECVIEKHHIRFVGGHGITNFFQLPLADKQSRAGLLARAGDNTYGFDTGRPDQFTELAQILSFFV
jgi:hypothetical protein